MCCAVPAQRPERPSADAAQRTHASSLGPSTPPSPHGALQNADPVASVCPSQAKRVTVTHRPALPCPHRAAGCISDEAAREGARATPPPAGRRARFLVGYGGAAPGTRLPPGTARSRRGFSLLYRACEVCLLSVAVRARGPTGLPCQPNCAASSRIAGSCCRALGHWSSCACPYVCGVVCLCSLASSVDCGRGACACACAWL